MPTSYPLDYRDINPMIRIAHRRQGPLNIPRRRIFDHELVLITKGVAELVDDRTSRRVVAGDVLIIFPFRWHSFRAFNRDVCEHIAIHFDLAPNTPAASSMNPEPAPYEVLLSDGLRLPDFIPAAAVKADEIDTEMFALVRAWANPRPPSPLQARWHLLKIILALLSSRNVNRSLGHPPGYLKNRQRVSRAIRYIDDHFAEHMNADDLAKVAALSVSQLTRLFRQSTGHTPMQYLRRARIESARQLLANVDLSVKEIARRCGFDDPYHFSRAFHQIDGLPPTLYREALLAGTRVLSIK